MAEPFPFFVPELAAGGGSSGSEGVAAACSLALLGLVSESGFTGSFFPEPPPETERY